MSTDCESIPTEDVQAWLAGAGSADGDECFCGIVELDGNKLVSFCRVDAKYRGAGNIIRAMGDVLCDGDKSFRFVAINLTHQDFKNKWEKRLHYFSPEQRDACSKRIFELIDGQIAVQTA